MKKNVKKLSAVLSVIMLMILASPLTVLAAEEENFMVHSGRWFRRSLPLRWR